MSVTLSDEDPFERALVDIVRVHRKKGGDYALDADPWSNFRFTAEAMGLELWDVCDVFIHTKLARLKALKANGRNPQNESVVDSRLDIAVYAIIALAQLQEVPPQPEPTEVPEWKVPCGCLRMAGGGILHAERCTANATGVQAVVSVVGAPSCDCIANRPGAYAHSKKCPNRKPNA